MRNLGVYPGDEEALLAGVAGGHADQDLEGDIDRFDVPVIGNGGASINGGGAVSQFGAAASAPSLHVSSAPVDPLVETAQAAERVTMADCNWKMDGSPLDDEAKKLHVDFLQLRQKRMELMKRKEELHAKKVADGTALQELDHRFGRLVVEEGRSRYINNSFWANLNNEVCRLLSCARC